MLVGDLQVADGRGDHVLDGRAALDDDVLARLHVEAGVGRPDYAAQLVLGVGVRVVHRALDDYTEIVASMR